MCIFVQVSINLADCFYCRGNIILQLLNSSIYFLESSDFRWWWVGFDEKCDPCRLPGESCWPQSLSCSLPTLDSLWNRVGQENPSQTGLTTHLTQNSESPETRSPLRLWCVVSPVGFQKKKQSEKLLLMLRATEERFNLTVTVETKCNSFGKHLYAGMINNMVFPFVLLSVSVQEGRDVVFLKVPLAQGSRFKGLYCHRGDIQCTPA